MSKETTNYDYARSLRAVEWEVTNNFEGEVVFIDGKGMVRCIVIDGMKIIAKILFAGYVIKFNTIEGYAIQMLPNEKLINVFKE